MSLFETVLRGARQTNNGIQAAACRSIQALLTTAIATGRPVSFWLDWSSTQTPDCSPARFLSWTTLTFGYGSNEWYHGPAATRRGAVAALSVARSTRS